jgi:hypothetical protein
MVFPLNQSYIRTFEAYDRAAIRGDVANTKKYGERLLGKLDNPNPGEERICAAQARKIRATLEQMKAVAA